jgi:hypothetical protein
MKNITVSNWKSYDVGAAEVDEIENGSLVVLENKAYFYWSFISLLLRKPI